MKTGRILAASLVAACLLCGASAHAALTVTADTNVMNLANALVTGTGITINSVTLSSHTFGAAASTGTYTVAGTGPYGITGTGIVLSTGNVTDYSSPNPNAPGNLSRSTNFATGATGYVVGYTSPGVGTVPTGVPGVPATAGQLALLDPITGVAQNRYDVTQLDINYTLASNKNAVSFDVVFGSEEFPEFVGPTFNDGFGLFVNGTNIAFAYDPATNTIQPINIQHTAFMPIGGTELDGVLAPIGYPINTFSKVTGLGASGTLTFIVADVGDGIFDTTVFVRGLAGSTIPEPSSFLVGTVVVAAGMLYGWRRKNRLPHE